MPVPRISRPLDTRSRVAAVFASMKGLRYGTTVRLVSRLAAWWSPLRQRQGDERIGRIVAARRQPVVGRRGMLGPEQRAEISRLGRSGEVGDELARERNCGSKG